ncbi:hypothetical protein K469DRAFT_702110 [Zopfia rhizophila CBS 207.26]|uniref:MFS general substrate transporter n=1 Tax=Zopfia rhizophila CBS 207.26 TaxID=1314779 RepID=A0A6A6DD89_9PEZI|nr:hypothetical protein K469DRAFT_702110 [Zopfia rhizophila CBS 207.26]
MRPRSQIITHLFLLSFLYHRPSVALSSHANFTALCEDIRHSMIITDPSLAYNPDFVCGRPYAPDRNPSLPIRIPLTECMQKCPGYDPSNRSVLSQWVGPLVGFLLPALAFVISIPRPFRMWRKDDRFAQHGFLGYLWLFVALLLMALDTVIWIIVVFALAGPLIVGALHEAFIDHAVLDVVEELRTGVNARTALTFTFVGSLEPKAGNLSTEISDDIVHSLHAREKLRAMLALLPSYGSRVGLPIVFYLGASAYTLFDAGSKLGDNDTAHAIAFGLWYGVIVIAATVNCSVLGVDNPASLEAIFFEYVSHIPWGPKPWNFYDSLFQPVWLWDRARVFQKWADELGDNLDPRIKSSILSRSWKFVWCIVAAFLISVPCALACYVSYSTPEAGFGCRSVIHLVYATSQIILILGWFYFSDLIHQNIDHGLVYHVGKIAMYCLCGLTVVVGGMFTAIGGTVMQLVGLFRNCICKAALSYLANYDGALVQVAIDTQAHRDSWRYWRAFGITGICVIAGISIVGWCYQVRTRSRCKTLIEQL